jgi:Nucleotidyl transferase AbiEii toxin, Type IV TA system
MTGVTIGEVSWERMARAVEKVRERLLRATAALDEARVPYAVVGGNAIAAWVSRVDVLAVRNTRDVDLLLRRADLDAATVALAKAGFLRRHAAGIEMFLDGPAAKARDAVHVVFAGERVRPEYSEVAPDVSEAETSGGFAVLSLEPLVRMKLTSFRDKDRTHLRDLVDVALVDWSWLDALPAPLSSRLRQILETPEG